ncbi:uncharacterized protein LOC121876763 [Homarus americanus]|uniref:uncharacterized protein LOC121876763 n=1 Tax=Homarus americanus TaxID=6706 RepID=UPI001C473C5C|nr:uncharacterized protein LOC121876763 [Homarus americanus]
MATTISPDPGFVGSVWFWVIIGVSTFAVLSIAAFTIYQQCYIKKNKNKNTRISTQTLITTNTKNTKNKNGGTILTQRNTTTYDSIQATKVEEGRISPLEDSTNAVGGPGKTEEAPREETSHMEVINEGLEEEEGRRKTW